MNPPITKQSDAPELAVVDALTLPATIQSAGTPAVHEFLTFFSGTIRNHNTRAAQASDQDTCKK